MFFRKIPGDINGDGTKDMADVSAYVSALMGTNPNPEQMTRSDFTGDGFVRGDDTQGFLDAFLQ